MKGIKLNEAGDWAIESGQLQMTSGITEFAQSVRRAAGTNKGEWFLNPDEGMRFGAFVGKDPSEEEMRDELAAAIYSESRVAAVEDITISRDRAARSQSINVAVRSNEGDQIVEVINVGS